MHNIVLNHVVIGRSPEESLNFNFDYTFNAGKSYYLKGNNGSGKTTLMRTLCGYIAPISGSISLDNLAYNTAYYGHRNGLKSRMQVKDYLISCFNIFDQTVNLDKLIHIFELDSLLNIPISYLSCGQQKRVSLVAFLCCDRFLYCFDEASSGLDIYYRNIFYEYIFNLANDSDSKQSKIILFTDHNMVDNNAIIHLNMSDFTVSV